MQRPTLSRDNICAAHLTDPDGHDSYFLAVEAGYVLRASRPRFSIFKADAKRAGSAATRDELRALAESLGILEGSRELQLLIGSLPHLPPAAVAKCAAAVQGEGEDNSLPAWISPALLEVRAATKATRDAAVRPRARTTQTTDIVTACARSGPVLRGAAREPFGQTRTWAPSFFLGEPIPGIVIRAGEDGYSAYLLSRNGTTWYSWMSSHTRTEGLNQNSSLLPAIVSARREVGSPLGEDEEKALAEYTESLPASGSRAFWDIHRLLTAPALVEGAEHLKSRPWILDAFKARRWPGEFSREDAA